MFRGQLLSFERKRGQGQGKGKEGERSEKLVTKRKKGKTQRGIATGEGGFGLETQPGAFEKKRRDLLSTNVDFFGEGLLLKKDKKRTEKKLWRKSEKAKVIQPLVRKEFEGKG